MSARIVKDLVPQMIKAMEAMAHAEVLVGIPMDSSKNARDDTPITNAEIGYINEKGAPELNIPARPFLVPGVDAVWSEAERRMAKAAKTILSTPTDPVGTVDATLNAVGLLAQGSVQEHIVEGDFAPLAEATLSARRSKGFDGTKPLIVTGSLKGSITYVVKT